MNEQPNPSQEYTNFRSRANQELVIGLFGEDLKRAQENQETISLQIQTAAGEAVKVPVLVPISDLEWYNTELIKRTYGEEVKAFVYVHPPTSGEGAADEAINILHESLEQGNVIVTEKYQDDTDSPIAKLLTEASSSSGYSVEPFGGDTESRVDFFAGLVEVGEGGGPKKAPSFHEVYEDAIKSGEIVRDNPNGPSLAAVIDGQEAEAIWKIYDKPFEDLGKNDPTLAGFTKEDLLGILKDPEMVKVVNRADGEITTLVIFLNDFEKAPWFNKEAYRKRYPDFFETDNIFMFPGIVTDEARRGNDYATQTVDFATFLASKRASDLLITFECTQESTTYVPQLVEASINHSGIAKISGLDEPIGVINYYAIKKN